MNGFQRDIFLGYLTWIFDESEYLFSVKGDLLVLICDPINRLQWNKFDYLLTENQSIAQTGDPFFESNTDFLLYKGTHLQPTLSPDYCNGDHALWAKVQPTHTYKTHYYIPKRHQRVNLLLNYFWAGVTNIGAQVGHPFRQFRPANRRHPDSIRNRREQTGHFSLVANFKKEVKNGIKWAILTLVYKVVGKALSPSGRAESFGGCGEEIG